MTEGNSAVRLRALSLDDIGRVRDWRNQPEVARYMYTDGEISEAEHARWFGHALRGVDRRYWIIELDEQPVGLANLYDISESHSRAYWAFYIASASARGRGVGSFTERFVMRFAFETLMLNKLCCEVLGTNAAVIQMHQRFGFHIDGVLRQHIRKANDFLDVVTMSLLAEEWRNRQDATD